MALSSVIANIILEGAITVEDSVVCDVASGKRVIGEGTLQDTDVENRNKRIYEKKELAPEINGARIKELISHNDFVGEAGHPLSDDLARQQTIEPKYTCVRYTKVWMEGNKVKARFKGTNNSYGETFDQDLREGVKPAFSLRALGTVENVNNKAYVRNLKIITYDRVHYPSHRCAYTEKIVTESALDGTILHENQIIVPENDPGKIIRITEGDARFLLNRLYRESADINTILETFEGIYDNVSICPDGRALLTTRFGERIYVNLNEHVNNVIMNYTYGY